MIDIKLLLEPGEALVFDLADFERKVPSGKASEGSAEEAQMRKKYSVQIRAGLSFTLLWGMKMFFKLEENFLIDASELLEEQGGTKEEDMKSNVTRPCDSQCWFSTVETECCEPFAGIAFGVQRLKLDMDNTLDVSCDISLSMGAIGSVRIPAARFVIVQVSQCF